MEKDNDYTYFVLINPNKHSKHAFKEYMDREGRLQMRPGRVNANTGVVEGRWFRWSPQKRKVQVHNSDQETIDFIKGYPYCMGSPNAPTGISQHEFIIAEVNDLETANVANNTDRDLKDALELAFTLEEDQEQLRLVAKAVGSSHKMPELQLHDVLQFARNRPVDFMKLVDSPETKYRVLIKEALAKGIITKQGMMLKFGDIYLGAGEEKSLKAIMEDSELYHAILNRITLDEEVKEKVTSED